MPKPETIGKLDRRILIQQATIAQNESNEDEISGWESIGTNPNVWAKKDERSGSEDYKGDKLTDYLRVNFTTRYRTDLNAEMRIVYEGIPYNIISMTEIERRKFLVITTETQEADEWSAEVEGAFSNGFSDGFLT